MEISREFDGRGEAPVGEYEQRDRERFWVGGKLVKRVRRIKRLKQSGKMRRRKQSKERRIRAAQAAILKQAI